MKKWSLIIFTILSQMAVGAFWVLMAISYYLSSQYGNTQTDDLILYPLIVVEIIMLCSLPVSLAHLGSPFIAYRTITNFRSSWLSREIVFAILFTLSSTTFIFLLWKQIGSANIRSMVAFLAVVFGFLLIYSMSRLYMLRTVPVWNTLFTPISFYLTALALGGLVSGMILASSDYSLNTPIHNDALNIITTSTLFILGCEFVLLITRVVTFMSDSSKGKEIIQNLLDGFGNVFYSRLILSISGLAFLTIILSQILTSPIFYILSFLLVLLAEIADRFLFYTARELSIL